MLLQNYTERQSIIFLMSLLFLLYHGWLIVIWLALIAPLVFWHCCWECWLSYLRRLISDWDHAHNLRSATTSLSQSSSRTTLAKRTFRCSAPSVWNSLPRIVVDSDSIAVFKSKLYISLLSGLLSFLFSLPLAHYLAQRLWSYDHMALYKCLYYY